jgi:hypothetical protein
MSGIKEEIRQALNNNFKQFLNSSQVRPSKICTVLSVSADPLDGLMICDCKPVDGTSIIEDVKIIADNNFAGFILVPTEGSFVEVTFNSDSDAFVSMVSQVDKIYLNGNDYGGLVKITDLVTKINTLETKLNTIITWGLTVTPPLPPTPLITPTTKTELENTTVQHGIGNLS